MVTTLYEQISQKWSLGTPVRDVEQLEILCFNALNSPKQAVNSIQCLVNWRAVQRKRLPVTEENVWSSLMPFFTRHPFRLC